MSLDAGPISAESCRRAASLDGIEPADLAYACRLAQTNAAEGVPEIRSGYNVVAESECLLVSLTQRDAYWFPAVHQRLREADTEGRFDGVADRTMAALLRSVHDIEFRSERVRSMTGLSKLQAVQRTADHDALLVGLDAE